MSPTPSANFGGIGPGDSLAVFSFNVHVGAGDLLNFLRQEAGVLCRGPESATPPQAPHFVIMVQEAFRRWEKLPALDDADLAARKRLHDPHPHGDPDILEVAAEFHRTLFTGNQTRVRQAKGLLESLLEVEEEAGNVIPVLMAGDFNTWSGYETTLTLLRREFPDSPPWDGHTTMGPFPTDHIFFRTHGESWLSLIPGSYRVIENQYLSDHQALVVWFRMDGSSDGIRPRLNPGGGI